MKNFLLLCLASWQSSLCVLSLLFFSPNYKINIFSFSSLQYFFHLLVGAFFFSLRQYFLWLSYFSPFQLKPSTSSLTVFCTSIFCVTFEPYLLFFLFLFLSRFPFFPFVSSNSSTLLLYITHSLSKFDLPMLSLPTPLHIFSSFVPLFALPYSFSLH